MKHILLCALVVSIFAAQSVHAALVPSFSAQATTNDRIDLTIYGDPNKDVALYYTNTSGSDVFVDTIGSTNTSGYYFRTVSRSTYTIPTGASAYVLVNGMRSSAVAWPYGYTGTAGALSLGNTTVSLKQGETRYVSVYGGSHTYTVRTNSNPSAVTASVSGDTLTLYATNTYTSSATQTAVITLCDVVTSYGCSSVSVTVPATTWYGGTLGVSATTIALSVGQSKALTITGGGSVTITGNTNASAVGAYVSGSTLTLYGAQSGQSVITLCNTGSASCVSVTATVYSAVAGAPLVSGDLTLGQLPYTGDTGPDIVPAILALLLALGGFTLVRLSNKAQA